MKTQFTPIAMRFNKENWESIKDKIEAAGIGHNVWAIGSTSCYLANNWQDDNSLFIGNHSFDHSNIELVDKVYETWDEAIFLRACGIEPEVYTVPKEFILEGHKAACSTWKAKIEAQFPELFPKLEVRKWYKTQEALVFINKDVKDNSVIGYGFDGVNNWTDNWHYYTHNKLTPATDEEVKTALIAEVKRRGFKEGVKFKTIDGSERICTFLGFNTYTDRNEITSNIHKGEWEKEGRYISSNPSIFKDGKWAEIISEPIEVTLEQIAEKFNVDVSQIKIKS